MIHHEPRTIQLLGDSHSPLEFPKSMDVMSNRRQSRLAPIQRRKRQKHFAIWIGSGCRMILDFHALGKAEQIRRDGGAAAKLADGAPMLAAATLAATLQANARVKENSSQAAGQRVEPVDRSHRAPKVGDGAAECNGRDGGGGTSDDGRQRRVCQAIKRNGLRQRRWLLPGHLTVEPARVPLPAIYKWDRDTQDT